LLPLRPVSRDLAVRQRRSQRAAAGLTLADVSARCGIDQPALSRLENGRTAQLTLDMMWRYAAALGKRLVLAAEDVPDTRTRKANGGNTVAKKMAGRKKRTA